MNLLLRSFLFLACVLSSSPGAAAPLRSGPQPGERPLPFTSNMLTGPNRGQQHCYVCELKQEPVVLVFARGMNSHTGPLVRALPDAVRDREKERLFAWIVFLGEKGTDQETALEAAALEFARENQATGLAVSALGDPQGPPGYRIAADAEVTVLLYRDQKVVTNLAFRRGEWNGRAVDAILKAMPGLLAARPIGDAVKGATPGRGE